MNLETKLITSKLKGYSLQEIYDVVDTYQENRQLGIQVIQNMTALKQSEIFRVLEDRFSDEEIIALIETQPRWLAFRERCSVVMDRTFGAVGLADCRALWQNRSRLAYD